MSKKFPYQKLISVTKTPYFGLYEVVFEDQLFYTDDKMRYLFSGSVIDLKTMANLTEAREKQLYPIKFDSMPLQLAIKRVIGKGTRRVAVFSDPNCGYCKKLEHEMQGLTDVTIYYFPVTLLPGSEEMAQAIWCAPSRLQAWEDHMLQGVTPAAASCNTQALREIGALARKMNIYVTPTLVFEDGYTKAGWMETEPLEQQLAESSRK
ncbi:MAG TPA: DsbC family protein [Gallionellaceae bacterium]